MGELGLFVIFIAGLGVLPAVVLIGVVVRLAQAEQQTPSVPVAEKVPSAYQLQPCGADSGAEPAEEPLFISTLLMALRVQQQDNYIDRATFERGAFDLTIKRRASVLRKQVRDLGGEAEVPMVLQDRQGTAFLTHHKVYLN